MNSSAASDVYKRQAVTSSVLSSVLGVFISYWTDSSTAGCIVLAQTAQFVLAFLLAPGQGVLRRL